MTYDDIVDWTDGTEFDIDNYDDFDEWVSDIKADFGSHGHYFPPETTADLEDYWVDIKTAGESRDDDDEEQDEEEQEDGDRP